jgi:hypothetical protein
MASGGVGQTAADDAGKRRRCMSTLGGVSSVLAIVLVATLAHIFFGDAKLLLLQLQLLQFRPSSPFLTPPSHLYSLLGFFHSSPLARLDVPDLVCDIPPPFPTSQPTSRPLTMALAEDTKRVVDQFDFSTDSLNKHVQEFLRQMDEGLQKEGTSISQIPTYVTGVPNGTEKVSFASHHMIAASDSR